MGGAYATHARALRTAQANDKYWAVPWAVAATGGGLSGSLYIRSVHRPGKAPQSPYLLRGACGSAARGRTSVR